MFITFLSNSFSLGTTFLFGSTGETITEKSGHLNLGIPGIMCVGALGGCYGVSLYLKSVADLSAINGFVMIFVAMLFSVLFAAALGCVYSFLTVSLRANQNMTGLTITTFGVGVTKFFAKRIDTTGFATASTYFQTLFSGADSLGWFGTLFLSHGFLTYFSIIIALLTAYVLNKTRVGLQLRAVGENPATADAAGIRVTKYKYFAILIGSAIAGLGGLYYIMDRLGGNGLQESAIDAMGWLSLALVIFTLWRPNLSIIGSILFGGLYIAANYIGGVSFSQMQLLKLLPYVVTIVVLVVTSVFNSKENQPPAALGLSYFREER